MDIDFYMFVTMTAKSVVCLALFVFNCFLHAELLIV